MDVNLELIEHLASKCVELKGIIAADFMETDKVVLDELRRVEI